MAVGKVGTCVACGRVRHITGRMLCSTDHDRARRSGTLDDYPRFNRTLADFAADFRLLRDRGMRNAEIARELGYQVSSISKIIWRARDAGLLR